MAFPQTQVSSAISSEDTVESSVEEQRGAIARRRVPIDINYHQHAAVSPDGKYITDVERRTGNLLLHNISTGETRCLFENKSTTGGYVGNTVISPDSEWVAFGREDNLNIIKIDGSDFKTVLRNDAKHFSYFQLIDWSPDAKRILVARTSTDGEKQIGWVSVADGSLELVTTLKQVEGWSRRPQMSPGGPYLVYESPDSQDSSKSDIFVLDLHEKQEHQFFRKSDSDDRLLGWAGEWILFASDRLGTWDAWVVRMQNGKPQDIPRLVWKSMGNPKFNKGLWLLNKGITKDGSFYYGAPSMSSTSMVYTAEFDPKQGILWDTVTSFNEKAKQDKLIWPAWSHNGKRLAASDHGEGIFVQRIENEEVKKFAAESRYQIQVCWSADDKSIWTIVTPPDERNREVMRIDVETGKTVSVLEETDYSESIRFWGLSPASDGQTIYVNKLFGEPWEFEIVMYDLESGKERELYRASNLGYPIALSPDDKWLAFCTWGEPLWKTIDIIPATGGEIHRLTEHENSNIQWFDWSPDGNHLYYITWDEQTPFKSTLWKISIEGGSPEKIFVSDKKIRAISFHPNGKRIAFMIDNRGGRELWALENFLPEE